MKQEILLMQITLKSVSGANQY